MFLFIELLYIVISYPISHLTFNTLAYRSAAFSGPSSPALKQSPLTPPRPTVATPTLTYSYSFQQHTSAPAKRGEQKHGTRPWAAVGRKPRRGLTHKTLHLVVLGPSCHSG